MFYNEVEVIFVIVARLIAGVVSAQIFVYIHCYQVVFGFEQQYQIRNFSSEFQ